jgi:hypothetical protein
MDDDDEKADYGASRIFERYTVSEPDQTQVEIVLMTKSFLVLRVHQNFQIPEASN